jgi:para-aminobenzoate N-oxygenase AurF
MSQAAQLLGSSYVLPQEERLAETALRREEYEALIRRISHQSVVKHFDAYADIEWDKSEFAMDPADPRWELSREGEDADTLGVTAWYQAQPQPIRARIGLHMVATFMKIGVQFESVLKRGLLEFASLLPNRSPEFRYCYHEVIEESQHSLMFQEFVNRTGFDIGGLGRLDRFGARMVVKFGRTFPELFFVFVLAGEDPIDHVQRELLRKPRTDIHPLLRRIMQIHVTEEARHLCFARHYLRRHVPELSTFRKMQLAFRVPFILGAMAQLMMQASPQIIREYKIPKEVVDEAYRRNPRQRAKVLESVKKLRELCIELGILNRRSVFLWKRMGIWPEGATLPAPA